MAQPPGLEKPNATPCPCSSTPPGEDGLRASPGGAAHEHSSRPRLLLPQIPPVTPNPPHGPKSPPWPLPSPCRNFLRSPVQSRAAHPAHSFCFGRDRPVPVPPAAPRGLCFGVLVLGVLGPQYSPMVPGQGFPGGYLLGQGSAGCGWAAGSQLSLAVDLFIFFLVLFPSSSRSSAPGPGAVGAVLTRRGCDLPKQKAKSCKTGAFAPKSVFVFFFFFAPFLPLSVEELSRLDLLLSSPSSCPRPPPPACCCTELRRCSRGLEP